jgi:hypothetical protein
VAPMGAGVRSIENQRNPCRVHVEHAHARLAETISGAYAAVLTDLGKKLLMDGHTGTLIPGLRGTGTRRPRSEQPR